ncbi:MAG TPA: NAD(+) synthase [Thermomicrobiales bacterium]|nr:NAD(+) synthase [Thermomicrobiales bacterium]
MSVPTVFLDAADALALADEITEWLRARLEESGAERFVLGLSGGIDSAVVAALCARAAGPDRVLAVIMPSASNPDDAIEARKTVDTFGIACTTVDLTTLANSFYEAVPTGKALYDEVLHVDPGVNLTGRHQLAEANVRPRLRMTTLYYLANLSRGVVVGTGNKTEYLIGYFTKYGDGGVDLMPLVDLHKYEVRAVARAIGVPESTITRPPSAGLWQGQTDEDEIGLTYDELDATLEAINSGDTSAIDPAMLARVETMVRTTAHKRKSVPRFERTRG